MRYMIHVEACDRDPLELRRECEADLPAVIEADDDDEANERAATLLAVWRERLLSDYRGPRGTEPTGLGGLCVAAVREATHAD